MLHSRRFMDVRMIIYIYMICDCFCKGSKHPNEIPSSFEAVFTTPGNLGMKGKDYNTAKNLYDSGFAEEYTSRKNGMFDKTSDENVKDSSTKAPKLKYMLPSFTETALGNDTHHGAIVTWTNFDSKVLFILTCDQILKYNRKSFCTSKSNVYRSFNYGESFDLELEKFANTSMISAIFVSPINRNLVFALDRANKNLYISVDEGTTYYSAGLTFDPMLLSFHPTLANIILVRDASNKVYISKDTGKSWRLLMSKVRQFFWSPHKNTSQIFLEVLSMQNTKLPTKNYSLVYVSKEPFNGKAHLLDPTLGPIYPNSLVVKQDYIYIQQKTSAGNRRLLVFYKHSPAFVECELPTNQLHMDYHFLQGDVNQVMLAALTVTGITNLYIASENGQQFSLVLTAIEAHWGIGETVVDIHRVHAVPGTFIANQIGKGTVISYNNGGLWKRLIPPDYDAKGNRINCYASNCIFRLSLYVKDRNIVGWSPITASRHVPGVIIAQGTIVRASRDITVSLCGYISLDGGRNWKQGLLGRHVYRLLDHGALFASIAITDPFLHQNKNKLEFSCDGGSTWKSAILPNQLSRVVGVAAHPAAKASILKIFGADISESKMLAWRIWKVNFSMVFDYRCSEENYTMWTAGPEKIGNSCILGKKYIYEKRKHDVCCSYGSSYERKLNVSVCPCSMADFECDFGFKRDKIRGYCTPTSFASLNPPVNCPEGKEYVQSKGYIKIKGDKCQGGIEKEVVPVRKMCPAMAPDGLSLSVQKFSIALGKIAEVVLHQKSGFLGTRYTWDFGDGAMEYNLTFSENKRYHKYKGVGTYEISVLASNTAGSFTAKTVMRIIERVSEVFLHVTKPVVAMEEATYTAELFTHGPTVADRHGFVHFAWIFEPIETPVLSLNSSVRHTYSSPGTYEVEVRVFNAIGVVSTTMSVTVFGDVRVLELQFSSVLDLLNNGTKEWNNFFELMATQYLIEKFKIRREMVLVSVSKSLPTIVTLYLVQNKVPTKAPSDDDSDKTAKPSKSSTQPIDTVMKDIISHVRGRKLSFFLMGQEVAVLEVTIIRGARKRNSTISKDYRLLSNAKRDLYIGVSVGGLFFVAIIVFWVVFCKRKLKGKDTGPYLEMREDGDTADYGMSAFVET